MAYCTYADIQARAGGEAALRAFDRDGDGTQDVAGVATAIAWGAAIIDAKLSASHATPFTGTVAVLVRELNIDLAFYRVATGGAAGEKSPYRQVYVDAMALLADLAKNREAQLPNTTPAPFDTVEERAGSPDTPFQNMAERSRGFVGF